MRHAKRRAAYKARRAHCAKQISDAPIAIGVVEAPFTVLNLANPEHLCVLLNETEVAKTPTKTEREIAHSGKKNAKRRKAYGERPKQATTIF